VPIRYTARTNVWTMTRLFGAWRDPSELIADLSWDTREPSENHVKQLVRRVRRALVKSDIGDLIESRHRFGYRLRAIPATDKPVG